jgi:hypothetical protein
MRRDWNGKSETYKSTYISWKAMVARCTRPSHQRYAVYGGAGITVCDRWLSFDAFLDDMGERPLGKTLDRVDNNKGYLPENCRWATRKEQSRNRRDNQTATIDGETKTLAEWAELNGLAIGTLERRINHLGWDPKFAVTTPVVRDRWKIFGKNPYEQAA